jgi:hypothetical protein
VETPLSPEMMPPETQVKTNEKPEHRSRLRHSKKTLILAFANAVGSDGVSFFFGSHAAISMGRRSYNYTLVFPCPGLEIDAACGSMMEATLVWPYSPHGSHWKRS